MNCGKRGSPKYGAGRPGGAAFTLVELLVATAIGSLLVLMVASVLGQVLAGWRTNSGRVQAEVDARVALQLLSDDLRSIVVRGDGTEWLRVVPETDVGPAGNAVEKTPWLMFSSEPSDPDRTGSGDVSAISYRVAYRDPFGGELPLFALYRRVLNPMESTGALGVQDLDEDFWASKEGETVMVESLVAANLVGLEIVFWLEDSAGILHPVGTDREIRAGGIFSVEPPVSGLAGARARYADISITLLDAALAEPGGGASFVEHVRKHGRVFTERVDFSARAR